MMASNGGPLVKPAGFQTRILVAAVLIGIVCLAVLSRLPEPTTIESVRTSTGLQAAIGAWGPVGCARVGFALGFDYLFMAAYVTALGLGCAAVAGGTRSFLRPLGLILAYAQIASGLVDATENAALFRLLVGGYDEHWMSVARLATATKFAIPLAGLAYIVIGWLARRWRSG
jgi:hypothetical protein